MRKVLITGHLGFIGRHLHKLVPEADGLDVKNGPLEDICVAKLDTDYTHIFHLAALRSAPLGEEYPREFIESNCWGTVRLLKRYPMARFMNITSASAEKPMGVYGATKKFAEIMGLLHPNVINVRPYNIFGEGQEVDSKAVIPLFFESYFAGNGPTIYGDGSNKRDFTYVGDLVREMIRLMFETKNTGLFHAGYSNPITILELARMIWGEKESKINHLRERSFDVDISKAPYPIKSHYGRKEGLRKTMEWFKNGTPEI